MSDTGHTELLPCPFCGSNAEMEPWHGGGPNKQLISCASDTCDARPAVTGETPDEAVAAWNRRASPSLPLLVEALREAVGCLYSCRYSEVPLAQKLDAILKEQTGQTYGEHIMEAALASIKGGDNV